MSVLLEVDRLTKVYSLGNFLSRLKIVAVDNVSFSVKPAEVFTLAGESGCGKTTTARLILGFEYPTSGVIRYRGKEVEGLQGKKWWFKEVQAVFQNPFETFNPLKKVESYFFATVYNYDLADSKRAERFIDEKLQAVGLSLQEIWGKRPGELSGGQLQRASIARALLTNPSLLIADEPVSMVDASLRMSIVNLLRKLCDTFGLSVIYITHDLATAYYISNRVAIMFRGTVVEMGPAEILVHPKHPYTKLLLQSILMPKPKEEKEEKRVSVFEEEEEYLQKGCKFVLRCPEAMEVCEREAPCDLFEGETMVKCHLYR